MNFKRRGLIHGLIAISLALGCQSKQAANEIVLGAATSMRHVFPRLIAEYEKNHPGEKIVATYGASGDVARQVQAGAGMDLVVFAGKAPLDKLVESGHVDAATVTIVGTNELVLVGSERSPKLTFATLDLLPANERLAIGDPKTVPVGQYAREALEHLFVWDKLQSRVVFGANVAAVLAYLEQGEVAAAIVYRTEIQNIKGVVMLDVAKGSWAPRPEIWAGVVVQSHNRRVAQEYANFLVSTDGKRILGEFGFGPP